MAYLFFRETTTAIKLNSRHFAQLPALVKLVRAGRWVIYSAFICSILYNIMGLSVSVKGLMSSLIAAMLMPVSTLSVVLIRRVLAQRMLGLKRQAFLASSAMAGAAGLVRRRFSKSRSALA